MRKILIVSPHFPPSNLAAVHRSRLFAQHLPALGWEPIILAVHEDYYEEELDHNLSRLIPAGLRIEKTTARKVGKPRLVGDIGLRGFWPLYRKAKDLIQQERINFLYIPIPSFYAALLGRLLHLSTGVAYGIDYIDPWVHPFPKGKEILSRHWFSEKLARMLEPIAIKHSTLITGVAEGYYQSVLDRNPHLKHQAVAGAMPYGGEATDFQVVKQMNIKPYLFQKKAGKIQLVYAGAMLPKAYGILEELFVSMASHPQMMADVELHFIGTGSSPDDPNGFNIRPLAEQYGLWDQVVFEYPKRIPYLDVLVHLQAADGIFILGSTEPHYTPSKVFQAVLSEKPILAVLHEASTALQVIKQTGAGLCLAVKPEQLSKVREQFAELFMQYRHFAAAFDANAVDRKAFEPYTAYAVTASLVTLLDQVCPAPTTSVSTPKMMAS